MAGAGTGGSYLPCETRRVIGEASSLYAAHFARGRYFNPWGAGKATFRDLLRWKLSPNKRDRSHAVQVPFVANDGAALATAVARPELTWIGHASFALQVGARVALTDPHFGPRALVPRRFHPPGLPIKSLPLDTVAVLSHNHYDHLDRFTLERLPKSIAWGVPLGLGPFLRRFGFREVVELDWWRSVELRDWKLTLLPAQHWSRRLSQSDETTLWGSWMIETAGQRVYFGGDSGYFHGFTEIGRRFPGIDLALLPIGAYQPRWFMKPVHMDPPEALQAFRDLRARQMIPMHWGTFDLTDEPIDEAAEVLRRLLAAEAADLSGRVRPLAVGETCRPFRED